MTTTRRSFLAAAGAAGAIAPFIRAEDKSGSKNPIIGEGEYKYECIHDWGELPSNIKYGNTHSVAEDAQGHIYIHHTVYEDSQSPDAVVVFDQKGKFVRSFGAMFRGGAHGMHLSKEGKTEYLYFCDEKHGIITKRTLKGEEVWTMGYPQDSPVYAKGIGVKGPGGAAGLNYRPTNFAIAPNGDFWVGDGYGSYYMFHYSVASPTAYPKLVNTFGGPAPIAAAAGRGGGGGRGAAPSGERPTTTPDSAPPAGAPGAGAPPAQAAARGGGGGGGRAARPPAPIDQMNNPHGNMVDLRDPAKPILLVADRGHGRIVRYTLDDKPIDIVEGNPLALPLQRIQNRRRDPRSRQGPSTSWTKTTRWSRSSAKGANNPPRTTTDRSKFIPGQFVAPHGAIFDHSGNIFVVEWVEIGRVTKLRKVA